MEQNLKYIIETCDGVQKFVDGHLMDASHQVDPSITYEIISSLNYWDESFDGLLDYDEYENESLFGDNTESSHSLL